MRGSGSLSNVRERTALCNFLLYAHLRFLYKNCSYLPGQRASTGGIYFLFPSSCPVHFPPVFIFFHFSTTLVLVRTASAFIHAHDSFWNSLFLDSARIFCLSF